MTLRHLLYLRALLFLSMLLTALYSPQLRGGLALAMALLAGYALTHGAMTWSIHAKRLPPDWALYASPFDVFMIAAVIYATSGFDMNLYIAYFVLVIGSLLLENAVFAFLLAAVACVFYALTVASSWAAFSRPENLLPCSLLTVSAFFITCLATMFRAKRLALSREAQQRALWEERLRACRQVLAEVQDRLRQPLDKVAELAKGISDQGRASDIRWEVEGAWGQLKRMGSVLGMEKTEQSPMTLDGPMERALFRLEARIREGGFDIDFPPAPAALVRGNKEQLAELFYGILKDILDGLPNGGKVAISAQIRPAQWWERSGDVKGWLALEFSGARPAGAAAPAGTKPGAGWEAVEWILTGHGGRAEAAPQPAGAAPRRRIGLPICGFPETAAP